MRRLGDAPCLRIRLALPVQKMIFSTFSAVGSNSAVRSIELCTISRSSWAPAAPFLKMLMLNRTFMKMVNSLAEEPAIIFLIWAATACCASSLLLSSLLERGINSLCMKPRALARNASSVVMCSSSAPTVACTSFSSAATSESFTIATSFSSSDCISWESTPMSLMITAPVAEVATTLNPSIAFIRNCSFSSKRSIRMSSPASAKSGNLLMYFGRICRESCLHLGPALALSRIALKSAACSAYSSTPSLLSFAWTSTSAFAPL
mmetsp:Transcript_42588/g.99979  ORF Transcript_42588/g.99979 Transcript_42588/m.99979 type:complete len:263 (-) Transcript_42588:102-890(-)